MEQEHKQLLLKDLSARLPYGVKFLRKSWNYEWDQELSVIEVLEDIDKDGYINNTKVYNVKDIKPYLFPLSSMTEKQCYELASIRSEFQDCWKYIKTPIPLSICNFKQIEFFHRNHLDYRGLIPMGLAKDATGLNIY